MSAVKVDIGLARKIGGARREFSEKGYDLGEVSEFP
jgi:hypothetical protein